MPTANAPVREPKIVPLAPESSTSTRASRVRLSKALAPKPAGKPASVKTPAPQPNSEGAKPKKIKLLSNRYTIPKDEYEQLAVLKKRLMRLGIATKKSELLRAGLLLLVAMSDAQLKKAVARVGPVKVRRPNATELV